MKNIYEKIYTFLLKLKYRNTNNVHLLRLLNIELGINDIAIDCGANVGEITRILGRNGSRVYAFEPNPFAYKVLCQKVSKYKNIICIQAGVYKESGKSRLFFHKNAKNDQVLWSSGSSMLSFKNNINNEDFIEIEIVNLSDFICKLNQRIKVVKMDIEGAECDVINQMILDGSIDLVDQLFVERHDHKIAELKQPMKELENLLRVKCIDKVNFDWI